MLPGPGMVKISGLLGVGVGGATAAVSYTVTTAGVTVAAQWRPLGGQGPRPALSGGVGCQAEKLGWQDLLRPDFEGKKMVPIQLFPQDTCGAAPIGIWMSRGPKFKLVGAIWVSGNPSP